MSTPLKPRLDKVREKLASDIAGDLGDDRCCFYTAKNASSRTFSHLAPLVIVLAETMDDIAYATSHADNCSRRPYGKIADCDCHISLALNCLAKLEEHLKGLEK